MTAPAKRGPRVSAKALIVRGDALLTIQCRDPQGPWYILPGGGQELNEPLEMALRRECREEVGVELIVHRPVLIRDYIGKNHEFANEDNRFHQVEIMFWCELPAGSPEPHLGHSPDKTQEATAWLPLARLAEFRIYPRTMIPKVQSMAAAWVATAALPPAEYLGDAN